MSEANEEDTRHTRHIRYVADKLAALDNHAARRMHVSEWQHLRTLAAAEGDSRIVAECDCRIAKLTDRPDGGFIGRAHARLAAKLAEARQIAEDLRATWRTLADLDRARDGGGS